MSTLEPDEAAHVIRTFGELAAHRKMFEVLADLLPAVIQGLDEVVAAAATEAVRQYMFKLRATYVSISAPGDDPGYAAMIDGAFRACLDNLVTTVETELAKKKIGPV